MRTYKISEIILRLDVYRVSEVLKRMIYILFTRYNIKKIYIQLNLPLGNFSLGALNLGVYVLLDMMNVPKFLPTSRTLILGFHSALEPNVSPQRRSVFVDFAAESATVFELCN